MQYIYLYENYESNLLNKVKKLSLKKLSFFKVLDIFEQVFTMSKTDFKKRVKPEAKTAFFNFNDKIIYIYVVFNTELFIEIIDSSTGLYNIIDKVEEVIDFIKNGVNLNKIDIDNLLEYLNDENFNVIAETGDYIALEKSNKLIKITKSKREFFIDNKKITYLKELIFYIEPLNENNYEKSLYNSVNTLKGTNGDSLISIIKKLFGNTIKDIQEVRSDDNVEHILDLKEKDKIIYLRVNRGNNKVNNIIIEQCNHFININTIKELIEFIEKGFYLEYVNFKPLVIMDNIIDNIVFRKKLNKNNLSYNRGMDGEGGDRHIYYRFDGNYFKCYEKKSRIYYNNKKVKYMDDLYSLLEKNLLESVNEGYEKSLFKSVESLVGKDIKNIVTILKMLFSGKIEKINTVNNINYDNTFIKLNLHNKYIMINYNNKTNKIRNINTEQFNIFNDVNYLEELINFFKKGLHIENMNFYLSGIHIILEDIIGDIVEEKKLNGGDLYYEKGQNRGAKNNYNYYIINNNSFKCYDKKLGIYYNDKKVKYMDDLYSLVEKNLLKVVNEGYEDDLIRNIPDRILNFNANILIDSIERALKTLNIKYRFDEVNGDIFRFKDNKFTIQIEYKSDEREKHEIYLSYDYMTIKFYNTFKELLYDLKNGFSITKVDYITIWIIMTDLLKENDMEIKKKTRINERNVKILVKNTLIQVKEIENNDKNYDIIINDKKIHFYSELKKEIEKIK